MVWIPEVIISPQGLSKGGRVFLDTYAIAKNTQSWKLTVEAPFCGPEEERRVVDVRARVRRSLRGVAIEAHVD